MSTSTAIIPRHHREAKNTYKLPRGEAIRKELGKFFRAQRLAILDWMAGGKKDMGDPLPDAFPDWDDFGLGNLAMSERMAPKLEAIWDEQGKKFTAKIGLDPDSWQVTNPHTQDAIDKASLDFCTSTNETTSLDLGDALAKTREALSEGIIEKGEGVAQLTKRIKAIFDGAETWRARRIATSEASRATHAAQMEAAVQSQVVTGFELLISEDACPLCQTVYRRARAVKLGQVFAVIGKHPAYSEIRHPPLHPSCCLPGTPVIALGLISGIAAQYDGPVIRIRCSDGSDVTITPNHMLLTVEGFAPASALVEGDDVIRYGGFDRSLPCSPDDDWKPPLIEQVVGSFSVSGGMASTRVPVSPEYLHGDAAFCNGDIDVIATDRLLGNHRQSSLSKPVSDHVLECPDVGDAIFPGCGDLESVLIALCDATDGRVGSLRERKAAFRAHSAHPDCLAFGATTDDQSGIVESFPDRVAGYAACQSEAEFGFAGLVSIHDACGIDVHSGMCASLVNSPDRHRLAFQPRSHGMAGDSEGFPDRNGRFSSRVASHDGIKINVPHLRLMDGFRSVSDLDPVGSELLPDRHMGDSERLRDTAQRFPGQVTTCKVVDVERFHYVGPVYDLETTSSLYLIGRGIASSNCQCSINEILDIDKQPKWAKTLHDPEPEEQDYAEGEAPEKAKKPAPPKAVKPKPIPPKKPVPVIKARLDAWKEGDAKVKAIQDVGALSDPEKRAARFQKALKDLDEYTSSLNPGDRRKKAVREKLRGLTAEYDDANAWAFKADEKAREKIGSVLKAKDPLDFSTTSTVSANADRLHKEISKGEQWLFPLVERGSAWNAVIEYDSPDGLLRANAGGIKVHLGLLDNARTVVHEIGHCLEDQIKGVIQAEKDFLEYRIKGQANEKFKDLFPDHNFDAHEEGADDEFGRYFSPENNQGKFGKTCPWYVGKHYSDRSEVVSMGLEALYEDGARFAQKDPEYCKFIVGILSGDIR